MNSRVLIFPLDGDLLRHCSGQGGLNSSNDRGPARPTTIDHGIVAIDRSASPNRVYVTDTLNNRILGWKNANTLTNGQPADLVLGQPDFVDTGCDDRVTPDSPNGVAANSLCFPFGIVVDSHGNLSAGDTDNNRVLEYDTPFAKCNGTFPCVGSPANRVWGQGGSFGTVVCGDGGPDAGDGVVHGPVNAAGLCEPSSVALDSAENLYVTDSRNCRVLEFDHPLSPNLVANLVVGQGPVGVGSALLSNNCAMPPPGPTPTAIVTPVVPTGIPTGNPRPTPPKATPTATPTAKPTPGSAPSKVSGLARIAMPQIYGSSKSASSSPLLQPVLVAVSRTSMGFPLGLALDNTDNLYVGDTANCRVLEYDQPRASKDVTADVVFGQSGDFTTSTCVPAQVVSSGTNAGVPAAGSSPSAGSLGFPYGLATDWLNNLYVSDPESNRVLKFVTPLKIPGMPDVKADEVYGQGPAGNDFMNGARGIGNAGMYFPGGVAGFERARVHRGCIQQSCSAFPPGCANSHCYRD